MVPCPRRVRRRVAALVAIVALVASACGSRASDRVDELTDDLVAETDGALDETQARCVARGLDDAYGDDAFQEVVDAVAGADGAETRTAVIDIFADCDALDPLLGPAG